MGLWQWAVAVCITWHANLIKWPNVTTKIHPILLNDGGGIHKITLSRSTKDCVSFCVVSFLFLLKKNIFNSSQNDDQMWVISIKVPTQLWTPYSKSKSGWSCLSRSGLYSIQPNPESKPRAWYPRQHWNTWACTSFLLPNL